MKSYCKTKLSRTWIIKKVAHDFTKMCIVFLEREEYFLDVEILVQVNMLSVTAKSAGLASQPSINLAKSIGCESSHWQTHSGESTELSYLNMDKRIF